MANDWYANAPGNILLIAFKITIILVRMWARSGSWGGGGCDAESEAGPYSLGHINQ